MQLFQIDDDWKQLKDALNKRQQLGGGEIDRQLIQLLDNIQAARKSARASFRMVSGRDIANLVMYN